MVEGREWVDEGETSDGDGHTLLQNQG
jgi:hypothetical protein